MELDLLIAYLAVAIGVVGLILKGRYGYNPKLKDMDDSYIMDSIKNFGSMMSDIYSLPPVKIVIEDLSKERSVYNNDPIDACFMPKDKNGSLIIIDLEKLKRDGFTLHELCSIVIHEYTHYYDCSLFEDYRDWLKDYESNPWHYELRSLQSEKDYTKRIMKEYSKQTISL